MRFAFIERYRGRWPVAMMCRVLDVRRSGYYKWRMRGESRQVARRGRITRVIQVVRAEHERRYGSPRVYRELNALGYTCSLNFVAKLMRRAGVRAKTKRKFRCTTDSRHNLPVAPNQLERNFSAENPNHVWLSDITYVPTREGWLYVCTVQDLFSRRIVGWAASHCLHSRLVVDALQMAIQLRRPRPGLIVHSDRGSQYCSDHVQRLLSKHQLLSSMSRKGDCYDNAPMESFYRTLKVELVYWEDYQTRDEARRSIGDFIELSSYLTIVADVTRRSAMSVPWSMKRRLEREPRLRCLRPSRPSVAYPCWRSMDGAEEGKSRLPLLKG